MHTTIYSLSRFLVRGMQNITIGVLSGSRLDIECIRAMTALAEQINTDDIKETKFLQQLLQVGPSLRMLRNGADGQREVGGNDRVTCHIEGQHRIAVQSPVLGRRLADIIDAQVCSRSENLIDLVR